MIDSGIQSHTERRGSRDLHKTPIRRSRLQVRLHISIIDCAMSGVHFPDICSLLDVRIVTSESQLPTVFKKTTILLVIEYGILDFGN